MIAKERLTRQKFNTLKKYYDETWDSNEHTLHVGVFGLGAKTLAQAYDDATAYLLVRLNRIDGGLPSRDVLRPQLTYDWLVSKQKQAVERVVQEVASRYRFKEAP